MDFAVGKYLENGKLVELLQEYSEASIRFH